MAEPQTETDNLLDDVRAANAELSGERPPPAIEIGQEPADLTSETAEQKADRARDEAGRFAKATDKPRETLKVKDSAVAAAVTAEVAANGVAKTPEQREQEKATAERVAAPPEFSGLGRIQWDKLPAGVQQDLHKKINELNTQRAELAPLHEAFKTPAWGRAIQDAGSPAQAANAFGHFYHLFLTNPVQLINDVAVAKGIDLRQIFGQPPPQGDGTQPAPDVNSLVTQTVQRALAPIFGQMQQAENQQLKSTIDAFGSDPKHPYFQDVKVHMGTLMSAGAAKDMQDAYDQATWANPVIRQQLLEAQAEATKKDQAAQVAKARAASAVNLSGSPLPGAVAGGGAGSGASVLDDVRAAAQELAGA